MQYRPWPCKTTVQPQIISSKLQFSSTTAKLSTSNDLQYTAYVKALADGPIGPVLAGPTFAHGKNKKSILGK